MRQLYVIIILLQGPFWSFDFSQSIDIFLFPEIGAWDVQLIATPTFNSFFGHYHLSWQSFPIGKETKNYLDLFCMLGMNNSTL